MAGNAQRYSNVAILLHWLIAIAIGWNIWIGLWMVDAVNVPETQAAAYEAFQFHKSLGLTVLILSILRLGWRLAHPVPPLPDATPGWQRVAARLTHVLFYALMIAIPLTGWLYVSTGWSSKTNAPFDIPTMWFGLFQWPHIPGVSGLRELAGAAIETHEILAFATLGLLVLHIGAALKHHFADRDHVLWSMLPIVRKK